MQGSMKYYNRRPGNRKPQKNKRAEVPTFLEQSPERRNRRKRSRKHNPVVLLLAFLAVFVLGAVSFFLYQKYSPSKTMADLQAYFGSSEDKVAVYLDENRQDMDGAQVFGVDREGEVYLPFHYVIDTLNRHFYWDEVNKEILYTEVNDTFRAAEDTTGEDGKRLISWEGNIPYISISFIKKYTNLTYESYLDAENKRIYIHTDFSPRKEAVLKKKTAVRLKGGIKSDILTRQDEQMHVVILEELEKWSKIRTQDGFIGYVQNKKLKNIQEQTPVSDYVPMEFPQQTLADGKKVVLGWHQVGSRQGNSTLSSVTRNAPGMNVIAPTWFSLNDNQGGYRSYAEKKYVDDAHAKGLSVWPTINNFDAENAGGPEIDEKAIFSSTEYRTNLINHLMEDAKGYGFDGINVDFELVPENAGRDYIQFIRELSVACRKNGLILSVDSYVPFSYNKYYDIEDQGLYADYVIIMCYDEHYAGSDAGSVASIDYTKTGIEQALADQVPENKLVIGVPFYTRVWITKDGKTTSQALGASYAAEWAVKNHVSLTMDETTGQNYGKISTSEGEKEVWMEDETSMTKRLDLIRSHNLAGVGGWKLGQEPISFWNILNLNVEAS